MNGWSFSLVINAPETSPPTAPDRSPTAVPRAIIPTEGATPRPIIVPAAHMPHNASSEPTERSIPPEIITKVIPTAMMP
jgi:hypothetical protein